jgi:hypothetical protein
MNSKIKISSLHLQKQMCDFFHEHIILSDKEAAANAACVAFIS